MLVKVAAVPAFRTVKLQGRPMPRELVADMQRPGEIKADIRGYIVENFLLGKDSGFENEESLYETGILDSTSVMELVAHIEGRYGFSLEDEDLTEENLGSVAKIARFVDRKLAVLHA